jgi:N-acetylglutamate synthase-like GNAT family acetyltransferase
MGFLKGIFEEVALMNIRRAKADESEILSNIAIRSEASWNYDSNYMDNFKIIYKVTKEFISSNPTFVIEDEEKIIGFYGILINKEEAELEYLFIEPKYIGKGYGKLLWNHIVAYCRRMRIVKFVIITSPQAKEFYIRMGCIQIGEVASLIKKERKIPKLAYIVENN